MERINKQYATIYIDRTGECLKDSDFISEKIIDDYYSTPGFLQWNFYLICTEKAFVSEPEYAEQREEFLNNEKYARKFIVSEQDLEQYLEKNFPDFKNEIISEPRVILVKGDNWRDCLRKVRGEKSRNKNFIVKMGKQRDESMLTSISNMDYLRAQLIKHPNRKLIFGTHISGEFSIAQKKFKVFMDNEPIVNEEKM